ncbi:hypothetical protein SVIOM74S_04159 [Streptomyces violarus]
MRVSFPLLDVDRDMVAAGMPLMVWHCPTSGSPQAGGSVPRCT